MAQAAHGLTKTFGWSDYQSWDDGLRWELVAGEPFAMSPSPGRKHQTILLRLAQHLAGFLENRPCELFVAPFDVRLSEHDVVQPDLLVVCDPAQLRETHVAGPPTLIVEIASPATVQHDRLRKLNLYARSGVKEYWLVTPYPSLVEVLLLDGATYRIAAVFGKSDALASPSFPELTIPLEVVFDFPIPEEDRIDEVREGTPPAPPSSTGETRY